MSYMEYLQSGLTHEYSYEEYCEHARMSELRANDLKLLGAMTILVFFGAMFTVLLV